MVETGEEAGRLEVALHAGQIGIPAESDIIEIAQQTGLAQGIEAMAHALLYHGIGPTHVAVFQQETRS